MEGAVAVEGTAAPGPEELVGRVQELQERLEAIGDPGTRDLADRLVSAIVQMYGAGLERIVELLAEAGDEGRRIAGALCEDELVATLLLIHDLHPVPLEERVQAALDSVRPYMESHGGNVELLSLKDGIATIHLRGSCSDCAASTVTLELAIKQALEDAAPDLEALEVLGGSGSGPGPATGTELPVVMVGVGGDRLAPSWAEIQSVAGLAEGAVTAVNVAGTDLVVANVDGTLLAYHDRCAGCGGPLHAGGLAGGTLACPGCGRSFSLPRAGHSLDDEHMQLEPVPLLRDEGRVRVALSP